MMSFFISIKSKILEIGCGWGVTAIYCTKQFDAEVTGVDADPDVVPYLQTHAGLNEVHIKQLVKKDDIIYGTYGIHPHEAKNDKVTTKLIYYFTYIHFECLIS